MKPILFAPTATEFDNNGLGALVDAPRCKVREERNGPYELEMDYPVDGQHFSEIEHSAIIYAIPADGKGAQPFRIYEISKPFDGLCTIYAEHISYQLAHIPVTPFGSVTSVAAALQGLKNNAAESCPYTFWTDKTSAGTFEVTEPKSIRELLGGTQGSILDAFGGGEYEWDKYTVKLHQHRGQDKGVVIKYGRNLTDLKQEEAIDTTITGIYPFWSDSESGTLVTLPEKVIHSANAGNFPYNRTVVVDASSEFQDEPTVAQLRTFANNYITQTGVGVPKVSIDISFAPLWQTEEYRDIANLERVNLCDTVTVVFEKLGVTATAKVVKTEYDVLNERYETIELGDARTNLAREVSSDISNSVNSLAARIPTKNAIESIVDAQTALITGAMGGYIKIVYNAAGQPQELLFMDTDDIQTAVNVIRINKNGIGFSNDGYDPTKFVSAWTIDGKFSADFIATGHLLANYIQGGTLTLGGADNGNGVLQVLDANGNVIGEFDKDGLEATGNLIMKNGDLYGLIGDVIYLLWKQVECTVAIQTKNGFSVKTPSGNTITTGYTVIPESTVLREQRVASSSIQQSYVFTSDIENAGVIYYLSRNSGNLHFYSASYGGDTVPSGAPSFHLGTRNGYDEGVAFRGGGGSISASLNHTNTAATEGYGVISLKAPPGKGRNWTSDTGATISADHYGVGMTSGTGIYGIGCNYNAGIKISAGSYASIVLNGKRDSTNRFLLQSGIYKFRVNSYGGAISRQSTESWEYFAMASSSSRRYKHFIRPIESDDLDPHRLLALPIVQFVWNDNHPLQYGDMAGKTIPGIIAEDVDNIYPAATIHNLDTGEVESWDERRIIPGMLALIQEQDRKIKELEARLAKIEEMLT